MHYWWTRKPLITARAAVLGALLPYDYNLTDFERLLGLGKDKRSHNYDLNPEQLEKLKAEYLKLWGSEKPIILDPFCGGGSIPFEAMRVGAKVICNDYNPVAYLIEKATLEYPLTYGDKLYKDVKDGLEWVFEKSKKELENYYPIYSGYSASVAYIWAWMVLCPKCNFDTPLVGQWWLVRKEKTNIYMSPTIVDGKLKIEIKKGIDVPEGTSSGGKGRCLACGSIISNDDIKIDIAKREEEKLLAIVVSKNKGKDYVLPSKEDLLAFEKAKNEVKENWDNWVKDGLVPLDEMPEDNRGAIWAKLYLKYWHKLLNPRQKLFFVTLLKNIKEYSKIISNKHESEYGEAVITYISFIFGKHIDYNCRSTTWIRTKELIGHALASRGIAMSWDHAEVNPFVKGSGTLISVNSSILDGLNYSIEKLKNKENIKIIIGSITALKEKVDIIVTDPPYFDDVQYAELSEFFYVWERLALSGFHELGDVPKTEDMSVGGSRKKEFFNKMFEISCKKMHENLKDNGLIVMFFAHSSIDAWDFVINSLQKSGFRITATFPIHTESTTNPLARGHASMMSSIIIVARKRIGSNSGYIEEIKEEVEIHLKKRLEEFYKYGLLGADLTVSAMGAALDIITQYSEIKSYTGEMKIRNILELVQKYVAEFVLNKYTKDAFGLDSQTSFYLYSKISDLNEMPFDTASLISKSFKIDLKQFEKEGLISSTDKGKEKGIKILSYNKRTMLSLHPKSLIDAVHLVMAQFEKGGFKEANKQIDDVQVQYSKAEIKAVLEVFLAFDTDDIERKIATKILENFDKSFSRMVGEQTDTTQAYIQKNLNDW